MEKKILEIIFDSDLYKMTVNLFIGLFVVANTFLEKLVQLITNQEALSVFKSTTAYMIVVLVFVQKGYDALHARRKYKQQEVNPEVKDLFNAHYLAGIRLMEHRLYIKAIGEFEIALNLNYDNDKVNAKIAKCKHLQDHDQ